MINVYGVLRHTFDNEPLANASVVLTPMRVRSDDGVTFGTPVFAHTNADGILVPDSRTQMARAFGDLETRVPIAEFTDATIRIGVVINHSSFSEPWLGELIASPNELVNIASASPLMEESDREDIGTFKELLELARGYSETAADWAQSASVSADDAEDSRDDARVFREAAERASSAAAESRVAADMARADAQAAASASMAARDASIDAADDANAYMHNAATSAGTANARAIAADASASDAAASALAADASRLAAASSASDAAASASDAASSASAAASSAGDAADAVAQVQDTINDVVGALPDATTSERGLSQFATNAQTLAGTSTGLGVSPASLSARLSSEPRTTFERLSITSDGGSTETTLFSQVLSAAVHRRVVQLVVSSNHVLRSGTATITASIGSNSRVASITSGQRVQVICTALVEPGATPTLSVKKNGDMYINGGDALEIITHPA